LQPAKNSITCVYSRKAWPIAGLDKIRKSENQKLKIKTTMQHFWTEFDEYTRRSACECGAVLGTESEDKECTNEMAINLRAAGQPKCDIFGCKNRGMFEVVDVKALNIGAVLCATHADRTGYITRTLQSWK
jgi:hypothetical protein